MSRPPDQLIVNEYIPGQGIGDHVDHTKLFGQEVVSISLLSDVVMTFRPTLTTRPQSKPQPQAQQKDNSSAPVTGETSCASSARPPAQQAVHLLLRANSAVALTGESRYRWTHSIAKRKVDIVIGPQRKAKKAPRSRRISLTFRHRLLTTEN
jgi:alkylated DNA repair dioxygenase AlkB